MDAHTTFHNRDRTPLNAIIGFSEALKDGLMGDMSDIQHECKGDTFTNGQYLLSQINAILDLWKIEAGMTTPGVDGGTSNPFSLPP